MTRSAACLAPTIASSSDSGRIARSWALVTSATNRSRAIEVAAVVELGLEHAIEVLADDRVEAAEPAVVVERERGVVGTERLVEHRARELEVWREHGRGGAPAHLGADRGGGALEISEQRVEELGLDREAALGERRRGSRCARRRGRAAASGTIGMPGSSSCVRATSRAR